LERGSQGAHCRPDPPYRRQSKPRGRRTLATLREYLTLAPEAFAALLKDMQASDAAGGLVARAANRHLGKSDREAAGVLSAAQRHTHFLDSPRMTAVLGRSDFRFADLKRRNVTVFLVLPPDRLSTYSRWLRLLVAQSLTDMARDPAKPAVPVLYLLDEFAALGHLAPVERAMGLMAGYGVQLWPILQDVHQLRATYGQRAGTFLSNAGVLQVFGVNDHDSARLVSDLLGQETVVFQTMSRALDAEKPGSPTASNTRPGRCSPPMRSATCRRISNCCSWPGNGRSSPASSPITPIPSSGGYMTLPERLAHLPDRQAPRAGTGRPRPVR
jgi:type IV secretion system protein VirD4